MRGSRPMKRLFIHQRGVTVRKSRGNSDGVRGCCAPWPTNNVDRRRDAYSPIRQSPCQSQHDAVANDYEIGSSVPFGNELPAWTQSVTREVAATARSTFCVPARKIDRRICV